MSIRVLISGGAGYIGSILSQSLHDRKINFAVIDDLSNSSLKFIGKNFIFYKGNINNTSILKKIFQFFITSNSHQLQLVFHPGVHWKTSYEWNLNSHRSMHGSAIHTNEYAIVNRCPLWLCLPTIKTLLIFKL